MRRVTDTIPPPSQIDFTEEGDAGVFSLRGELDVATAPELRQRVGSFLEDHPGRPLVLDLGDVAFVDSTVLGVFVRATKLAQQSGASVAVRNPSASIRRVFELTGIGALFATDG